MRRLLIFLALGAALLGACATYHNVNRERLETLPQHYNQFDLRLAWETRVADGTTIIDGVAKNVRYAYMYDLEIWVEAFDPAGKLLARSVQFVIPRQLDMDEYTPFTLKLPAAVPPGTRLHFSYRYRGSDGGDRHRMGEGGTPWMQSFDAAVPGR
jgi:hypothetical protein